VGKASVFSRRSIVGVSAEPPQAKADSRAPHASGSGRGSRSTSSFAPARRAARPRRTKPRYLAENPEVYFDDIVDASERIRNMLENYKEIAEALEGTNESVISHGISEMLRVLTAISVVFLPSMIDLSIFDQHSVAGRGSTRQHV
jgi:hypothetical protein